MRSPVRWWLATEPPVDPPQPPAPEQNEALERARYEADQARAQLAAVRQQMAELQRQIPSAERLQRLDELEQQAQQAEELRRRREGEFDTWRAQIMTEHERALQAEREQSAAERQRTADLEQELNDELIGRSFAQATEWFGPTGKTVWFPKVAQSFFRDHIDIEIVPSPTGGRSGRRVVVKGLDGKPILDTKNGVPMAFEDAIGVLILGHPQKSQILRGSGKVGSGSAGEGNGGGGIDFNRLRQKDFQDPNVRESVRQHLQAPGGLQIGPGFDRIRNQGGKSK